ncbi:hypothetical protein FQZ97_1014820 [compost metagenome]
MIEHLEHRASGLDHHVRRQAFAQQVISGNGAVSQIDIGSMVDDAPIDLFWHAHVETAISGLHMESRNLAPLGRNHRHAAIGIT